jgi:hypothetical protein
VSEQVDADAALAALVLPANQTVSGIAAAFGTFATAMSVRVHRAPGRGSRA